MNVEKTNIDVKYMGEFLRSQRRRWNNILGDIARLSGLTPKELSEIERGLAPISRRKLKRICKALRIERDYAFKFARSIQDSVEHKARFQ